MNLQGFRNPEPNLTVDDRGGKRTGHAKWKYKKLYFHFLCNYYCTFWQYHNVYFSVSINVFQCYGCGCSRSYVKDQVDNHYKQELMSTQANKITNITLFRSGAIIINGNCSLPSYSSILWNELKNTSFHLNRQFQEDTLVSSVIIVMFCNWHTVYRQ